MRPVQIPRFEAEPVIDGQLTDDIWKSAVVLKDFYQLIAGVNVPATLPTEVLLGYDDKYLYVGFRAFDKPRAAVWASLSRRDEIFEDDTVRIVLDTFNDKQRAYVFVFNPRGVVADGIFTEGAGEDYSLNLPVQSKGMLTGLGYTVEAAIPFKSLKYKAGKDRLWGINVLRNVKNLNNEVNSWMPISPNKVGRLHQAGHLTGLENISAKPTYEIISSLTVSKDQARLRSGPGGSLGGPSIGLNDNTRVIGQPLGIRPGLSAKINFNPSLTLRIALNPGYLAGTELFRPSAFQQRRRAAFDPDYAIKRNRSIRNFAVNENYLEGVSNFYTPLSVVSKYAVVNPDYVVELSGKLKSNSFDLLLARDPSPGIFSLQDLENPQIRARVDRYIDKKAYLNAFRVKRGIGKDSSLGMTATTYNFADMRSFSGGLDGHVRVDDSSFINFQILGVNSKRLFFDPDLGVEKSRTGNGFGYFLSYERQKRNFGISISAEGRSKFYRAELGFTRRFNYNRNAATIKYRSDTNPQGKLVAWRVLNLSEVGYDWQGRLRYLNSESKLDLDLPRETYISFAYSGGYERLLEEDFGPRRGPAGPGTFVGHDPERSARSKGFSVYGESSPNKRFFVSAFASYKWGEFDLDYDAGPRFPRVSPAALRDPDAALDPGPGTLLYLESSLAYRPAANMRFALDYSKSLLKRADNGRVAFDDNTFAGRYTYNFNDSAFIRTQVDYSTLSLRMRSQLLFGITRSSGKSFYAVYNDDHARAGYGPFFTTLAPAFRRNGRTFLFRVSYPLLGNAQKPSN